MKIPLPAFSLPAFMVVGLAATLGGCHGKRPPALAAPPPPDSAISSAETSPPARTLDEGPDVRPVVGEGATGTDIAMAGAGDEERGPLANVLFEYDSAALTPAARSTLDSHVVWLQSHRTARVMIEGHCDERGTVEYNLALGEQRARAVRDHLVSLGVAPDRLRVVSFGKEKPLDPSPTEAAYAKNRRAHFAVAP